MFRHSCAVKVQTERMYPSAKCVRRWQQKGDMAGVLSRQRETNIEVAHSGIKKTSK